VSRGDRRDAGRNNTATNFQVSYKFVGYQFKKQFPESWSLRITAMRVSGSISPLSDDVCAVVDRNQSRRPGDKGNVRIVSTIYDCNDCQFVGRISGVILANRYKRVWALDRSSLNLGQIRHHQTIPTIHIPLLIPRCRIETRAAHRVRMPARDVTPRPDRIGATEREQRDIGVARRRELARARRHGRPRRR
jgi:hypothetical protein